MPSPALKIVIAGSRAIPPGYVGRLVVAFLGNLPADTTILLRKGMLTEAGTFEQMVSMVCDLMGLEVEWRQVGPVTGVADPPVGRQLVFARDLEMVADADLTVCFTTTEQAYDMECGTTALAQKALEADKAVYHFAIHEGDIRTQLYRVGEHDPGLKYTRLVADLT